MRSILLPQFLQNVSDIRHLLRLWAFAGRDRIGGNDAGCRNPGKQVRSSRIIAIGFAATAAGLFHVTGIFYGIDFGTLVSYRILQVVGIPRSSSRSAH